MILIVAISLTLKTVKLVILLFNFSYFIGMGWLIMCKVVNDIYAYRDPLYNFESEDQFLSKFGLLEKSDYEKAIINVYFAFTSLSTVGLGDYHPRSDLERLIFSFIMPLGVAIFAYIMGRFIEMIN